MFVCRRCKRPLEKKKKEEVYYVTILELCTLARGELVFKTTAHTYIVHFLFSMTQCLITSYNSSNQYHCEDDSVKVLM